jgi:hypothetical protein
LQFYVHIVKVEKNLVRSIRQMRLKKLMQEKIR